MADDKRPAKTFMVCQQCGTLFRVEVNKADAQKPCVKCGGGLAPLKGDVPHDQIATVLFLRADETGPQGDAKKVDPTRLGKKDAPGAEDKAGGK